MSFLNDSSRSTAGMAMLTSVALQSVSAVGSIIGSPIAGALANVAAGEFLHAQIFAGTVMAVGVICLAAPLVAMERYDRKHQT